MENALITRDLTKVYQLGGKRGSRTALDSLTIDVPEGTIFGFLGPNGAGKTTTIKMILDFVRPTRGSATVFGKPTDDPATRGMIGYLPEQPYFHKFLKPLEVVRMHAALAGVPREDAVELSRSTIEKCGIAEYSDTPISKLSKGLTQRVGIAQALVADPRLLILDEPTSGLDPIGRRHTRDLLLKLKDEGKTVFLSSHLLSEVEDICDTVAVLRKGRLVACGPPDKVRSGSAQVVVETKALTDSQTERLAFLNGVLTTTEKNTLIKIEPKGVYELMRAMEEMGLPVNRIETQRESLEEAFLRLAA